MIQKNLIIISGTEPRILCSEVIRKNNSSMTHLIAESLGFTPNPGGMEPFQTEVVCQGTREEEGRGGHDEYLQ